jgi:DTW domain-containing protein YfiP
VVATRHICTACLRPERTCICQWVTPVVHPTEVLILQHPLETHHAKNSARLLHLSLPGSRLLVGEVFDGAAWLAEVAEPKYTVLLYPPTAHAAHQAPAPLNAARLQHPSSLRLVVLDATWRKSRKMLHASPPLQALPRLSLDDVPVSNYVIRKAHKPGQLSTLEATCAALAQLQGEPEKFQPLLAAFNGFVAQQLAFLPP